MIDTLAVCFAVWFAAALVLSVMLGRAMWVCLGDAETGPERMTAPGSMGAWEFGLPGDLEAATDSSIFTLTFEFGALGRDAAEGKSRN